MRVLLLVDFTLIYQHDSTFLDFMGNVSLNAGKSVQGRKL